MKKISRTVIPTFNTREEEAKFWETHSISDVSHELKPIKARFSKNLSEGLHIRLNEETLTKLRKQAKNKGIGPTTLVRMWIMEQLNISQHI